MSLGERLALPLLRRLDPETAHAAALAALRAGLGPRQAADAWPRLRTRVAGLELANPLGLAAGFDKNASRGRAAGRRGLRLRRGGCCDAAAAAGQPAAAALPPGGGPGGDQPLRLQQRRRGGDRGPAAGAPARRGGRAEPRGEQGERGPRGGLCRGAGDGGGRFSTSPPSTSRRPTPSGCATCRGRRRCADLLSGVAAANRALARPIPILLKISPDLSEAETRGAGRGGAARRRSRGSSRPIPRSTARGCAAGTRGRRAECRVRRSSRARRRCWRGCTR